MLSYRKVAPQAEQPQGETKPIQVQHPCAATLSLSLTLTAQELAVSYAVSAAGEAWSRKSGVLTGSSLVKAAGVSR